MLQHKIEQYFSLELKNTIIPTEMSFSFQLKVNCFWDLRRHLLAIKLPQMEIASFHVSDDEPSSSAALWSCIRDSVTLQGLFNCGFELCGRGEQKQMPLS